MANYTKDQVRSIIKNAPIGSNPNEIVDGLIARGHNLEGYGEPFTSVPPVSTKKTIMDFRSPSAGTAFVKKIGEGIELGREGVARVAEGSGITDYIAKAFIPDLEKRKQELLGEKAIGRTLSPEAKARITIKQSEQPTFSDRLADISLGTAQVAGGLVQGSAGAIIAGAMGFFEPEIQPIIQGSLDIAKKQIKKELLQGGLTEQDAEEQSKEALTQGVKDFGEKFTKIKDDLINIFGEDKTNAMIKAGFAGAEGIGFGAGKAIGEAGLGIVEKGVSKTVPILEKGILEAKLITEKGVNVVKSKIVKPIEIIKDITEPVTGSRAKKLINEVEKVTKNIFDENIANERVLKLTEDEIELSYKKITEKFRKETIITGKKVDLDFSKSDFANDKVPQEVFDNFINTTETVFDKGWLANNARKISDMSPSSGSSYKAAKDIKGIILENTSPKYIKLNNAYSDTSDALKLLIDPRSNIFLSIKDLPEDLASKVVDVLKPKAIEEKIKLIEELKAQKTNLGEAMGIESKNLAKEPADINKIREELLAKFKEKRIEIKETDIVKKQTNKLEDILKNHSDDIDVKEFNELLKLKSSLKIDPVALNLKKLIYSKTGKINIKNVKELIEQSANAATPEGDLIKKILGEDIIEITKHKFISPELAKSISDKIIKTIFWGGLAF
jgi:hypothetical protein